MAVATPRLSLVVPAFNEEARLGGNMRRIGAFLETLGYATEVLVVDDGSREPGRVAAESSLEELPSSVQRSFLRHEVNRGKGAAVRTGCLAARGQYVAFIDADLASPPEDLPALLAALEAGADVAIGERNQADGSDMRNHRSLPRRLAGRFFNLFMRTVLLPDLGDSQCPLKAFRRSVAQRLFRLQRIDTWSFDAELLFLADRLGLRVVNIPVHWQAMEGSHLKLNLKTATELWNLVKVRWAHRNVTKSTLSGELTEPASL